MKHAIFFPLYNIHSQLVKSSLGLKDNRSVKQFFLQAGVTIHSIGKKKCVSCEDLLNVMNGRQVSIRYQALSELSKQIDNLE